MKALWSSAPGLFFVTGGLLGLTLPLGKLAGQAGVPPTVWALTISLGAAWGTACLRLASDAVDCMTTWRGQR